MTRSVQARPRPASTSADGRWNLPLLWAGQFVNTAGLMMLVPIMPFYLEQIGTTGTARTQTWAGVAIAAPALALTVATPLWGRLGDRVGRKWMVVRALLGLAVAMVVMATATTPLLLVAGRLLQGTLGGVVEAAAAFAGSTGSDRKRGSALGKSFSATAAGALVGPIAGGLFVGSGGLSELMLVIAAAAAVLAIGCAVGLREPERRAARTSARRRSPVARVPGATSLALAAVAAYLGVYGLIPVFAEHLRGTEPTAASLWVGVLHSVMWGASLLGSFWWGKHNDHAQRPVRSFAVAALGCGASTAFLALPLDSLALVPFRLVQGFCFAALAQSLLLHFSKHAPAEQKSSFVGAANSYLLIGQSTGPLLAGPVTGVLPAAGAVLVMAAMCGLGALLATGPARVERGAFDDEAAEEEHFDQHTPGVDETMPLPAVEPARNGVTAVPFRGWHIAPHQLGRLGTRYATPWDRTGQAPAAEAARTLRAWQHSGTLVRDREPALYAYEQIGPRGTLRGILAAVHLDSGLLAHEDSVPEQISGIADLMHEAAVNLDPILLGFSGDGRTSEHLQRATALPPVSEVLADDGGLHRVWRVSDRDVQDDIAGELAARAAFIADGHHRRAAARQLRREYYATGSGPGPWDYVLGLLVDVARTPMRLAPVHRVLPHVDPRAALEAASRAFRIQPLRGELPEWSALLKQHARTGPAFVLVTPTGALLASAPNQQLLDTSLENFPPAIRNVHSTVLHAVLINDLWRVQPEHVTCTASARSAVHQVRTRGGLAVLTAPPTQADLRAAASAGVRLPPKSTSFGPKPHPGLVFRTLDP
ncbi:MFS transporter [Saccharopolyspora hirsuta]|uniref:MFS transporter n=1 Tax=Saccharopolyspora hirsuta TaxID=1837 RepID=A0A5M7CCA8_SACHI|nr:MFS transporter [Saccharopolyspora hirsuta]KAA5838077.1 MFS transporter [Saccharopolyspora hirsuta]